VDRLDLVIAARCGAAAPPLGEVVRALARYAPADATPASWRADLERRVAALRDPAARDPVASLPDVPWPRLAATTLPAMALGIAAGDTRALAALAKDDGWAAAVVARARGVWLDGPPPAVMPLTYALVWHHFALPGQPPARGIASSVLAPLLQQVIAGPSGPPHRIVRTEAARLVRAPRGDARSLRDALVRMWLAGRELVPPSLADRVNATALAASGDAVFGERKVFIAAIWDALGREPGFAMPLPEFKVRLVDAHRAGGIELARADYTQAMDAELVRRSETLWDGASFHFVLRQERPVS
jgi:hypothetical protein